MSDIADKIIKQLRPAEFPSLPELLVRELDLLAPGIPASEREAMVAGDLFLSARLQAETAASKSPDLAEETGIIVELGDWILDTAIAEAKTWLDDDLRIDRLAINFSNRQIEQEDFVDKIVRALKKHQFPGEKLEIEITESMLMNNIDQTVGKLNELHLVGVHVAIDDFGTGYSSLSLLQKLPIHRLKIDRSFIHDMEEDADQSIIEAIAHMARGLKLEMVAEGVEEEYKLRYLRSLNCPVIQGFIYSQAVPANEARELLSEPVC